MHSLKIGRNLRPQGYYHHQFNTPTIMSKVEALAGEWTPETNGDPSDFMEAIGIGWLKRKAISAALALGIASRDYTITVTEAAGVYTINMQDGKRDNTIVTDNKEFDYESATGLAKTFATVEDGRVKMTAPATDEYPETVTWRYVDAATDTYVTELTCPSKPDAIWRRVCKRK